MSQTLACAILSYYNNGIRIYRQYGNTIKELCNDSGLNPSLVDKYFYGEYGSVSTATGARTACFIYNNGLQVYTVDPQGKITERLNDGKWFTSNNYYSPSPAPRSRSGLACVTWKKDGVNEHRIFYQDSSNKIYMQSWSDKTGWKTDARQIDGAVCPDTVIGVANYGEGHYLRLYYQDASHKIVELASDDYGAGWNRGGFQHSLTRPSALSVMGFGRDDSRGPYLSIFFEENGQIVEYTTRSGSWQKGSLNASTHGNIALASYGGVISGSEYILVFSEDESGNVSVAVCQNNSWSPLKQIQIS